MRKKLGMFTIWFALIAMAVLNDGCSPVKYIQVPVENTRTIVQRDTVIINDTIIITPPVIIKTVVPLFDTLRMDYDGVSAVCWNDSVKLLGTMKSQGRVSRNHWEEKRQDRHCCDNQERSRWEIGASPLCSPSLPLALNLWWNLHCFGSSLAVLQIQGSEEMRNVRSLPLYLRFKTLSPLGWYIVSSWVEKRRYRALFGLGGKMRVFWSVAVTLSYEKNPPHPP